jgi:hypothetical protein
MLCEQMHYRDGGGTFSQSTFQVTLFILQPVNVSELPDKNLDYLTFRNEFIMHNASMIEKQAALQVKQDPCSTKIIVWFQHNCKPTSWHW